MSNEMIDRLRPVLLEALASTSAYVRDDEAEGVLVDGVIDPEKVIRALLGAMREPNHAQLKAMAESVAVDDEGEFPPLLDLLDFSGENKTRTVLRAAYAAMIDAVLAEEDQP